MKDNTFRCLGTDLDATTNTSNNYWDDFNNSTNLMLKAKINKSTYQIDTISNYSYSVIDIDNEEGNVQNKECYWTHNSHGHTAIDYDTHQSGSHFTSDLWNIQFILGINPKIDDKFYVRYKEKKGTIVIDNIKNQYPIYKGETTTYGRWSEWNEIKDFSRIKSQQNIYIDNIIDTSSKLGANDICITLNEDSSGANCTAVVDSTECSNMDNSLLYKKNEDCENVQYKNYKLIDGVFYGGKNKMSGGSVWVPEKYFYILPEIKVGTEVQEIYHNKINVKYEPSFKTLKINDWEWTTKEERNVIYNRILNNFKYDGYIEQKIGDKNIFREYYITAKFCINICKNKDTDYVFGEFKLYNTTIKNIKITTPEDYLVVMLIILYK